MFDRLFVFSLSIWLWSHYSVNMELPHTNSQEPTTSASGHSHKAKGKPDRTVNSHVLAHACPASRRPRARAPPDQRAGARSAVAHGAVGCVTYYAVDDASRRPRASQTFACARKRRPRACARRAGSVPGRAPSARAAASRARQVAADGTGRERGAGWEVEDRDDLRARGAISTRAPRIWDWESAVSIDRSTASQ